MFNNHGGECGHYSCTLVLVYLLIDKTPIHCHFIEMYVYVLRLFTAMHFKTRIDLCGLLCSVENVSGGHQSHKQVVLHCHSRAVSTTVFVACHVESFLLQATTPLMRCGNKTSQPHYTAQMVRFAFQKE